MVSAPTMPGTGGLFKSPFPTDAAPPAASPPEPRAVPSTGGEQRPQRPDLEVDWSHLERERAALASQKARREGDGHSARGVAGPLIGENEVGRGQRRERDRRDDRRYRDDHDERHDGTNGYDGYSDDGTDERRSARGDARDRYDDDRYDDDAGDWRGSGYGSGYTDQYPDPYEQRAAGRGQPRGGHLSPSDERGAWGAPRDDYDDPSEMTGAHAARDANVPAGERFWEPSGGLWGAESSQGDSAYFGAPAAGRAPGTAGKPARRGKSGKGQKAGKKGGFRAAWLISSVLSSALIFALVRFELQHSSGGSGTPNAGPNSAQVFTDGLLTNKNGWLTNADCVFKTDGYHLTRGYLAYAPVADATNFDATVQVTQTAGTTLAPYGLVFRRVSLGNYYVFGIDGNGKWTFYKALENVGSDIVSFTANPAIKQGLNAQNTLEVRAQGTHFTFFVNGTQVGQADDSSLAKAGALGVAGHDDIEVIFTTFSLKRLT
jgi:hypothetical protein